MPENTVIVGTLDTKGDQLAYIKGKIEAEVASKLPLDLVVI